MHFSITFIAALTIVAATPTPLLSPRACETVLPTFIQQLDSPNQGTSFANLAVSSSHGPASSLVIMYDNTNASNIYRTLQFIEFVIPPNSYACTLHLSDSLSTLLYTHNSIVVTPPPSINLASLIPNAYRGHPTYNDIFNANAELISSENFASVKLQNGDERRILNSEACPGPDSHGMTGRLQFIMSFGEGMNGDSNTMTGGKSGRHVWVMRQGSVEGVGDDGSGRGTKPNGIYMTYNC